MGVCHAIRGTPFAEMVGPDLTHLASRVSLAARTREVERDDLMTWIAHTRDIKPEVAMPAYDWLKADELVPWWPIWRASNDQSHPPPDPYAPSGAMLAEAVPQDVRDAQEDRLRRVWKTKTGIPT